MTTPDATARSGGAQAERPYPAPWARGAAYPYPEAARPADPAAGTPAAPVQPSVPVRVTAPTSAPVSASASPPVRHRAPAAALTGLVLLALLGAWLVAAPFLTGDQARGAGWTAATLADVATGAVLAGAALAGLFGYLAAAVSWLARYGH
jgi:hypothetical protein